MNLTREIAAMAAVGIVAFSWVFGQSPMPDQTRSVKSDRSHTFVQQVSDTSDQVAAVLHTSSLQKAAPLASIDLPTPDLVSQPQVSLLEVAATSLKMRAEPSRQAQLITVYDRGTTFEKIDQDGQWLQVRSIDDGTSGWMFAEFLQSSY